MRRFALTIAIFLCANEARAHYGGDLHDHSTKGASTHKAKASFSKAKSPAPSFDPWKLLDLALTPAYAAMTNVNISLEGDYRVIRSNGIPNHSTGDFPNPGNPNTISAQHYTWRVTRNPTVIGGTTPLGMYPFGVAINGIPFDPGAAEWWQNNPRSGWTYEAMYLGARLGIDRNNAHVQPNGAYHYHGPPTALLDRLGRSTEPTLIGYAADGFPIYGPYGFADARNPRSGMRKLKSSYRLKSGTRPGGPGGKYDGAFVQDYEYASGLGDLDDCNGRFGVTSEYPKGTYHYVVTDAFPYIPRGFKGTPDYSFYTRGGSMPGPARGAMSGSPGMGGPLGGRAGVDAESDGSEMVGPMGYPGMGGPGMGGPGMGGPGMGGPGMGGPAMGRPAMGGPAMGGPAMGGPAMGGPAMGGPGMGGPGMGRPAMGGPGMPPPPGMGPPAGMGQPGMGPPPQGTSQQPGIWNRPSETEN